MSQEKLYSNMEQRAENLKASFQERLSYNWVNCNNFP